MLRLPYLELILLKTPRIDYRYSTTPLSTWTHQYPHRMDSCFNIISTPITPDGPVGDACRCIIAQFSHSAVSPGGMATIPDLFVEHQIVTCGPPIFARPHRLAR
uniref:Uncharacterized protein n=1 Tax=Photinus pyralis TaxID=7054 RepID=A0A1Y1LS90_PHOPY